MNIPNKVIFLDIDGVLNSVAYDRIRGKDEGNIDETRLPLLKRLIDETQALIVLSSSWRKHWERDIDKCDNIGKEVIATFAKYNLYIYDKTKCLINQDRAEEIRVWLSNHNSVKSYVIFDDIVFGWGADLQIHLIKTNPRIGHGLEERHIQEAIRILNN